MKKLILFVTALSSFATMYAETIKIGEKDYDVTTIIDRDLGPGVRYTRLRLPAYPLNANMIRVDGTNPYNSVETTQANDRLFNTESLVTAAKRQSAPGHTALAGANANFWCVATQEPYSDQLIGVTYNGNLRNGKIITETNCSADQWNRGPSHTGIVGITADNKAVSGTNWTWKGTVTSDAGTTQINCVNKTVRAGELGLYNSYHGATRSFRPVNQEGKNFVIASGVSTEVYLSLNQGSQWNTGADMTFTVKEIKKNAGSGSVGEYDAVLVGRDANAEYLNKLTVGSQVTINTSWISPEGKPAAFTNLVGGNAQVMANSELLSQNDIETYNSQVYSRTGYGTNADGTTLYIIVIDKASDPVYGNSSGCNTRVMCNIAAHYGCTDMTNFDAGGSAEMFVGDRIVNKTTESSPRAVANGMFAYSIAPEDNTVARLDFYDCELKAPLFSSYAPRMIGYNKYGDIVTDDLKGFTLSCPAEAGTCNSAEYTAGGKAGESTLTATYNGVSVTKAITIIQAQPEIRIKPTIVIDNVREYPVEVTATVNMNTYNYNPARVKWELADNSYATIDKDGVLRGTANGTTAINAVIGDFTDASTVSVEIPDAPDKPIFSGTQNPSDWKITQKISLSAASVNALGTDGGFSMDYTVSSARAPKMTVERECRIYSLPDAIEVDINPGEAGIKQLALVVQPANVAKTISPVTKDVTLTASQKNTVRFEVSDFVNPSDLAVFPLTFKTISIVSTDKSGTSCHVEIPAIRAIYNNYSSVQDIIAEPAATDGKSEYFNLQGQKVSGENLTPGVYIRRNNSESTKVIIK